MADNNNVADVQELRIPEWDGYERLKENSKLLNTKIELALETINGPAGDPATENFDKLAGLRDRMSFLIRDIDGTHFDSNNPQAIVPKQSEYESCAGEFKNIKHDESFLELVEDQIDRLDLMKMNFDMSRSSNIRMDSLKEQLTGVIDAIKKDYLQFKYVNTRDIDSDYKNNEVYNNIIKSVKNSSDIVARKHFMWLKLDLDNKNREIEKRLDSKKFNITDENKEKLDELKNTYTRFKEYLEKEENKNKLYDLSKLSQDDFEVELGQINNFLVDKRNKETDSEGRQRDFSEIIDLYAPNIKANKNVEKKDSVLVRAVKRFLSLNDYTQNNIQEDANVEEEKSALENIKDECNLLLGRIEIELATLDNQANGNNERRDVLTDFKRATNELIDTIDGEIEDGDLKNLLERIDAYDINQEEEEISRRINEKIATIEDIQEIYNGYYERVSSISNIEYLPNKIEQYIKNIDDYRRKMDNGIEQTNLLPDKRKLVELLDSYKPEYVEKFNEARGLDSNKQNDRGRLVEIAGELDSLERKYGFIYDSAEAIYEEASTKYLVYETNKPKKTSVVDPNSTFVFSEASTSTPDDSFTANTTFVNDPFDRPYVNSPSTSRATTPTPMTPTSSTPTPSTSTPSTPTPSTLH